MNCKNVNWWNTNMDQKEIDAIFDAISNRKIGMGSITQSFENDISRMLKVPYVVATPSGSVALYMALMVLGVGIGDEVIVPDRTFIATAHAVKLTGADVILVDVNEDDTNININKIKEKITSKTKVILPVHLNGRAVNIEAIKKLAKLHNLYVVEDACQSLFSKNENSDYLGTLGDMGCFSLGIAKLITVGYGGFIVCHTQKKYEELLRFRNHGRLNNEHSGFNTLGFNFKVSDMIMAIGRAQLSKYQEKINHCLKIYNLYNNIIKDLNYIELIKINTKYEVPLYIEVIVKDKNRFIEFLDTYCIKTNLLPPSLHLSQHLKQNIVNFDNSLYFDKHSLVLPCGPNQDIKNIKYVIEILIKYKEIKND